MRYAVISDIHANLEALQAVMARLSKEGIDKYICPGDIVGYGANPRECLEIVRGLDCQIVCGNHESGCAGKTRLDCFNDYAKEGVIWTMNILSKDELAFMGSLPLTIVKKDFTVVHGTLQEPDMFLYMLDQQAAHHTFMLMKNRICFIGHTHVPGVLIQDAHHRIRYEHREEIRIEEGNKYIINAGSIGQPRDADNRASYCIYDTGTGTIKMERVGYDIEKAQQKIMKAGLPEMLAVRLYVGR